MDQMSQCHNCGGSFPNHMMADWTICGGCKQREMEAISGEPVFIDSLGIAWTKSEMEEAGGQSEVVKMAQGADVRNNFKKGA